MELNDCAEEGISMTNIQFTNNKPILDLFLGVRNIRANEPYIVVTDFSKWLIIVWLVFISSYILHFQKPVGILSILDEESRFPKATDKSLATKLHSGPGNKTRFRFLESEPDNMVS